MKPIQETVLVHFIMYYAVYKQQGNCTISVKEEIRHIIYMFHLSFGKVCHIVKKNTVHIKFKKSSHLVQNTVALRNRSCTTALFFFTTERGH